MLDGAIVVPVMQIIYGVVYEVAAICWWFDKALLTLAYFLMSITNWLVDQAFSPILTAIGNQTQGIFGNIFVIAILILGITYLLAVFVRLQVVEFKSAMLWFLFGAFLFQVGPEFYRGVEQLRRGLGGAFYQEGIDALSGADAPDGLNQIGASVDETIPLPTNQYGTFLPADMSVDGLDVATLYMLADGYDVLNPPGGAPRPIDRLPWLMIEAGNGGYFDPENGPDTFWSIPQEARQAAISDGIQGIWRLLTGVIIACFAVVEQLIHMALAIAMGIAFISLFVAILFAFFKRTERLTWSVFDLIIELFVQSTITFLLTSLIIGLVLIGAQTGNAVVVLGAGLIGFILSAVLLVGAVKAILGALGRLMGAFGQVTGGNLSTNPVGVAAALATGGATMLAGGTLVQGLGASLGGNRQLSQAAYYAAQTFRDTPLGGFAQQFAQGATAAQIGPVGGALVGYYTKQQRETQAEHEETAAYTSGSGLRASTGYSRKMRQVDGDGLEGGYVTPARPFDRQADAAISEYRADPVNHYEQLERAFGQAAPDVARLTESYDDDDFAQIVGAIRALRDDRPDLAPDSRPFEGALRQSLAASDEVSDRVLEMPPADLRALASALSYRPPADDPLIARYQREDAAKSRYDQAVGNAPSTGSPDPTPPFDRDVDRSLSRYRADPVNHYGELEQTLGRTAPDVARLVDAHDEDDLAQVVAAIRGIRDAQPGLDPRSAAFAATVLDGLDPSVAERFERGEVSKLAEALSSRPESAAMRILFPSDQYSYLGSGHADTEDKRQYTPEEIAFRKAQTDDPDRIGVVGTLPQSMRLEPPPFPPLDLSALEPPELPDVALPDLSPVIDTAEIAARVDTADDDDLSRLSETLSARLDALTTQRDAASVPQAGAGLAALATNIGAAVQAFSGTRPGFREVSETSGQSNPAVVHYIRQAAAMSLPGEQAQQMIMQVSQTGNISSSLRADLTTALQTAHPHLKDGQLEAAISQLTAAAARLAGTDQSGISSGATSTPPVANARNSPSTSTVSGDLRRADG